MPALRKFIVMPPPMVPAPMTAIFSILRSGVSSGTSGIFAADRSPKKAWRSARDSGVCINCRNDSRSKRTPSSNGMVTAAWTASTHLSGAGKFFAAARTVSRATWKNPSALARLIFISRTRFKGRPSATTLFANAMAPGNRSCSTLIEERAVLELLRRHGVAGNDHVERRFGADEPRQALRTARAWHQPQFHLGQGDLRALGGHAEVAAHGQLQPAAHAGAADRSNDGFPRVF